MLFGTLMFPTDYAIRPDELARLLEERGFESTWFPDHTHIPASRRTPYPLAPEVPREYWNGHDIFVAATAAALATTRLRIGTGVCLIIERDPIITAKQVASIDSLSGGRFIFGIGAGWNAEEMENHGTRFDKRFGVLRERVLAMKEIWTKEEPAFHGQFIDFDPIWCNPKPAQKPHPPVLIGGRGPRVFDRVVGFGDGWMPVVPEAEQDGSIMAEKVAALRAKASQVGRDPDSISVSVFGARAERDVVDRLEQAGVERMVFNLPAADRDSVEPLIDRIAALMP